MRLRISLALALAPIAITAVPSAAMAQAAAPADPGRYVNLKGGGVALHGYDAVAYFKRGAPVQGLPAFSATYQGARYQFADAQSKAAFEANPAAYAPQYGGFCAYGVARGFKVDVDPEAWSVVNGKLYLNVSKSIRQKWQKDTSGYIAKAETRWPTVKEKKSGVLGGIFS